jgi:hypothetical protein
MAFLLAEDAALRQKLQSITVTDQKADNQSTARQVGVWFGQPDQELRTQVYPYITIDMIDLREDPSRAMRGIVSPYYLQPTDLESNEGFSTHMPIPVNIDYQITTYSRHPRHDREILSQLLHGPLTLRFGTLKVEDGTVRRLDVVNIAKRDVTEQAKRLFVNAITVRVSSEIAQSAVDRFTKTDSVLINSASDLVLHPIPEQFDIVPLSIIS